MTFENCNNNLFSAIDRFTINLTSDPKVTRFLLEKPITSSKTNP